MAGRPRARKQSRRAGIALVVVPLALLALVVGGVIITLNVLSGRQAAANRCVTSASGTSYAFDPEAAGNASTIVAASVNRSLPPRAASIALVTAMQESKLHNITYGDRDSVGLFQQRPSQGWGTKEQILDPVYASNAFYDHLVQLNGYETMNINDAAQKVQRSGYPEAYAQHEPAARAFASALTGYSGPNVQCGLADATSSSPDKLASLVVRDYGAPLVSTAQKQDGGATTVAITVNQSQPKLGWSVANWAVAQADSFGVTSVQFADHQWKRSGQPSGQWTDANAGANQVIVTF